MVLITSRGLKFGLMVSVVWISGCFADEVDYRGVHEVQGLIYKVKSEDPFTGRVLNHPSDFFAVFGDGGGCSVDVKKGLISGEVVCRDKTGAVIGKVDFLEGKRHGKSELFDPKSGKLFHVSNFKHGKQDGESKSYSIKNGELIAEEYYSAGNLVGNQRKWSSDGSELLVDLKWVDGKRTGFEKKWDSDRQEMLVDLTWVDDKKTGYEYDLQSYSSYRDGKLHGLSKEFWDYSWKKIHYSFTYENGKLHGPHQLFDSSGNVTEEIEYGDNSILFVTRFEYDRSGQKIYRVSYIATTPHRKKSRAGLVKHGVEQFWDDKGQLNREVRWKMGKTI